MSEITQKKTEHVDQRHNSLASHAEVGPPKFGGKGDSDKAGVASLVVPRADGTFGGEAVRKFAGKGKDDNPKEGQGVTEKNASASRREGMGTVGGSRVGLESQHHEQRSYEQKAQPHQAGPFNGGSPNSQESAASGAKHAPEYGGSSVRGERGQAVTPTDTNPKSHGPFEASGQVGSSGESSKGRQAAGEELAGLNVPPAGAQAESRSGAGRSTDNTNASQHKAEQASATSRAETAGPGTGSHATSEAKHAPEYGGSLVRGEKGQAVTPTDTNPKSHGPFEASGQVGSSGESSKGRQAAGEELAGLNVPPAGAQAESRSGAGRSTDNTNASQHKAEQASATSRAETAGAGTASRADHGAHGHAERAADSSGNTQTPLDLKTTRKVDASTTENRLAEHDKAYKVENGRQGAHSAEDSRPQGFFENHRPAEQPAHADGKSSEAATNRQKETNPAPTSRGESAVGGCAKEVPATVPDCKATSPTSAESKRIDQQGHFEKPQQGSAEKAAELRPHAQEDLGVSTNRNLDSSAARHVREPHEGATKSEIASQGALSTSDSRPQGPFGDGSRPAEQQGKSKSTVPEQRHDSKHETNSRLTTPAESAAGAQPSDRAATAHDGKATTLSSGEISGTASNGRVERGQQESGDKAAPENQTQERPSGPTNRTLDSSTSQPHWTAHDKATETASNRRYTHSVSDFGSQGPFGSPRPIDQPGQAVRMPNELANFPEPQASSTQVARAETTASTLAQEGVHWYQSRGSDNISHLPSETLAAAAGSVSGYADKDHSADRSNRPADPKGPVSDQGKGSDQSMGRLARDETALAERLARLRDLQESIDSGASNKDKGKFGENTTYDNILARGFNYVGGHGDKPQGIDSIWEKNGHYFVVESKFGSSGLGSTKDGKQASDTWVVGRLSEAVGRDKDGKDINGVDKQELALKIANQGYYVCVAHVHKDGNVSMDAVDRNAKTVRGSTMWTKNAACSPWAPASE